MGKLSSRDRLLAHQDGQNVSNVENRQFETLSTHASQLILQGPLPIVPTTGFPATAQGARFSYIGYTQKDLVVDYVQFIQTGALAAGTQVIEVGLATTTSAPDGNAQTFTVVAVTGNLPDLTTGTMPLLRQNTTAFAYAVSPGIHLWAAMRCNFATTQPTTLGVSQDLSMGMIQRTASVATPLTVGTSYLGAPYAQTVTAGAFHPYLRLQIKA